MVQHTLVVDEVQPGTRVSIVLPPPKGVPSHEVFVEAMLDRASAHQSRSPLQPSGIVLPPPKVAPSHEVFAEVMLDRASAQRWRNPMQPGGIVLPPPKVAPSHEVFAEATLDRTSARQPRSPLDWGVSILVHTSVLVLLLLAPLYFTQGLDLQRFNLTFLVTPAPPAAAPPPPPLTSAMHRAVRAEPTRVFKPGILTAPTFIPKVVAPGFGEVAPPEDTFAGVPGGVPGGLPGGIPGGQLGGVLGGALNSVAKPAAVTPGAMPRAPVRVGGVVKPPRLLFGPEPRFPSLARQSRLSGIVVIEAIIDEHGNVIEARVVSGHPLLIQAALEAVKERKYEPTILDGEPTPIDLRVEVTFHFS